MSKNKKNQKGVSVLLTLLIMAVLLVIVLGVSQLALQQIRITRDIIRSVVAFYAGDSAVEYALYEKRINGNDLNIAEGFCDEPTSINLDNESNYGVKVKTQGETIYINSNGCYRGVTRAIEASYPR